MSNRFSRPACGPATSSSSTISATGHGARKAIQAAGAELRFLPSYSPDLNPIEQVFAKLKNPAPPRNPRPPIIVAAHWHHARLLPRRRVPKLHHQRRLCPANLDGYRASDFLCAIGGCAKAPSSRCLSRS